jgi:hypothetical protein
VVTNWSTKKARTLATPKPPAYCADGSKACVAGAKQMIYVFNNDGDNIAIPDSATQEMAPGYNWKNGFRGGAQNDIFTAQPAWNAKTHSWKCEYLLF